MVKEKIFGITNKEKALIIRVKRSDTLIKNLNNIIISVDKTSDGLYDYSCDIDKKIPKYSKLIGRDYDFFYWDESLYVSVFPQSITLILRKDSKHFETLNKLLLEKFSFIKVKLPKEKKK